MLEYCGAGVTTMIAFIQPPQEPPRLPATERARQFLAKTLLPQQSDPSGGVAPVAAWKARLFAGWLIVVALWGCFHAVVALF